MATEPYGYGGQSGYYTDRETGLQLLGFRYYDPAAGRFLTRDPSGYAGGANLDAYALNSPVDLVDPSGLSGINWAQTRATFWRGWCGVSDWVDTHILGGGMSKLGSKVGCYEAGRASAWEVAESGAIVVYNAYDAATTVVSLPKAVAGLGRQVPKLLGKGKPGGLPRTPLFRRNATPTGTPQSPMLRMRGETAHTAKGKAAHKNWDPGPGYKKERTLPSGKRVDGINYDTQHVKELKPNNPRAVRRGQKQVQEYVDELNGTNPGWTGDVETY